MITPEEALGQIYAMRESHGQPLMTGRQFAYFELALALADIIDDLQAKICRMEEQRVAAWGWEVGGKIVDVIMPKEHEGSTLYYKTPLFRLAGAQKIIEDF